VNVNSAAEERVVVRNCTDATPEATRRCGDGAVPEGDAARVRCTRMNALGRFSRHHRRLHSRARELRHEEHASPRGNTNDEGSRLLASDEITMKENREQSPRNVLCADEKKKTGEF